MSGVPVDLFASEQQYLDHLLPIWRALPEAERDRVYLAGRLSHAARDEGLGHVYYGYPPPADAPVLVASFQDTRSAARAGRRTIYVEHGAGQTYDGDPDTAGHPSYSGSGEHESVVLFVCPNETVAARWRSRYPTTPAVAVGSPRLDAFVERPPARRADTVAISFHADVRWVPETTSAWNHYLPGLRRVVEQFNAVGVRVLGHAHPRLFDRIAAAWETVGAVPTRDFADVLRLAGAYAVDNSSTLYEAAAVGIPVVAMNAPWYRRDVHHGLRFWNLIPGEMVDGPDDLADALLAAVWDPPEAAERRRQVTAEVYAGVDGKASARAAEAVLTLAV